MESLFFITLFTVFGIVTFFETKDIIKKHNKINKLEEKVNNLEIEVKRCKEGVYQSLKDEVPESKLF